MYGINDAFISKKKSCFFSKTNIENINFLSFAQLYLKIQICIVFKHHPATSEMREILLFVFNLPCKYIIKTCVTHQETFKIFFYILKRELRSRELLQLVEYVPQQKKKIKC